MQRKIWASLKTDQAARTAQVGASIKAKLAWGDVKEAFQHLKGWYQNVSETMAHPLPINIDPVLIDDGTPTDAEVR